MSIINFILAIIALVLSVLAYQRAGGTKNLRDKTADTLRKMENALRKMENKSE